MKNPFKKAPAPKEAAPTEATTNENPTGEASAAESPQAEETPPKTKKELLAEKAKAKREKQLAKEAKKKAAKAQKEKNKKSKGERKSQKKSEPKKPKLTKEEKAQLAQDKAKEKAKRKTEKIRAQVARKANKIRERGARRSEKLQLKKEQLTERKQAKQAEKAAKKQFKKEIRDEIRAAKQGLPRSKLPFILIPLAVIILLSGSVYTLSLKNIGPFAALDLPQPPGFLTSIKLPSFSPPSLPFPGTNKQAEAEKVIEGMFDSLIGLDFAGAGEYMDMSALDVPDDYLSFVDAKIVMNAVFDRLEYEIIQKPEADAAEEGEDGDKEAEEEGPKVIAVTVNVTAVSIRHLMSEYTEKALAFAFSNAASANPLSEPEVTKRISEIFTETAAQPGLPIVKKKVEIKVEDTGENLRIIPDAALVDALFGGALSAAGDFFTN